MLQTILALIKKEFYQVRRDPIMLRLLFVMPLIQLLVLGYAISTDVRLIATAVYDFDNSGHSREYMRSLSAGDYFIMSTGRFPILKADHAFKKNLQNAVIVIPDDFSEKIDRREKATLGMMLDGTNANTASITMGYAGVISARFNKRLLGIISPISLRQKQLYNPEGESVYYMVPGIVAVLLTMITVMLTSMAIVREREVGTLEQLMVTPITVPALILGKTIPFALIGFVEISVALIFGIIWFKIPFAGSWPLLYGLAFVYLFTTLGVGMFISTITKTQQQAMFFAWFFSIFTIITSGFFIPIPNMPKLIQYVTYLNPLRYFMKIVRGIMMKGAALDVLYPEVLAMLIFGAIIFSFSWIRFSKRIS
ncbi:MAG: ABC transporter permease [Candidatus Zixiibacteriota bacterium]|nr:MAG: ABC transporter permease [candidate division Zixibacteria bacterium]